MRCSLLSENRDLRARIYRAYGTRASDQGPNAGDFDNGPRIARILKLRHEAAALLGFTDPVDLSLATKMAPNAAEVMAFLRDLAKRARPAAESDLAEMQVFAASECDIGELQSWDVGFVSNRLRRTRYAVDSQEVRTYFPVERVLAGWQDLLLRLFGVRLVERDDVSLYHPDARYFDVAAEHGTVFRRSVSRSPRAQRKARRRVDGSGTTAAARWQHADGAGSLSGVQLLPQWRRYPLAVEP